MYRLQPGQSRTSKPSLSSSRVTTYASPQRHSWEKLPPSASSKCISSTFTLVSAAGGSIHTQNEMRDGDRSSSTKPPNRLTERPLPFVWHEVIGLSTQPLPLRDIDIDALVRSQAHLIGHDNVPGLQVQATVVLLSQVLVSKSLPRRLDQQEPLRGLRNKTQTRETGPSIQGT